MADTILIVDDDAAVGGTLKQVDAADKCALAGTGQADYTEYLTVVYGEVYVLQSFHRTGGGVESFAQVLKLYHLAAFLSAEINKKSSENSSFSEPCKSFGSGYGRR